MERVQHITSFLIVLSANNIVGNGLQDRQKTDGQITDRQTDNITKKQITDRLEIDRKIANRQTAVFIEVAQQLKNCAG